MTTDGEHQDQTEQREEQVTKYVEHGKVSIKREYDYEGEVKILSNGWVHLTDRGEMYPPDKIKSVVASEKIDDISLSIDEIHWPVTAFGVFLTLISGWFSYRFFDLIFSELSLLNIGMGLILGATFLSGIGGVLVGIDSNARTQFHESTQD